LSCEPARSNHRSHPRLRRRLFRHGTRRMGKRERARGTLRPATRGATIQCRCPRGRQLKKLPAGSRSGLFRFVIDVLNVFGALFLVAWTCPQISRLSPDKGGSSWSLAEERDARADNLRAPRGPCWTLENSDSIANCGITLAQAGACSSLSSEIH